MDMIRYVLEGTIASLEKYVGKENVQKLSQDATTAYRYLNHHDPKIRFAALTLVWINDWITEEIADISEEMALSDPDENVRGQAIIGLTSFYDGTNNSRIGRFLAKIVCNEDEGTAVRKVAYRSLFLMPESIRLPLPAATGFRFPADVDWALVRKFRNAD